MYFTYHQRTGDIVPPHHPERIAILLRNAKERTRDRQYPYLPTADELAAELTAKRRAHAETRMEFDELRAKYLALSAAYLGLHRKKRHAAQVLAALRDTGGGARTVHCALPH